MVPIPRGTYEHTRLYPRRKPRVAVQAAAATTVVADAALASPPWEMWWQDATNAPTTVAATRLSSGPAPVPVVTTGIV